MEYRRVIQEFPNGTNINLIPILTPEEEKARHQRLMMRLWSCCVHRRGHIRKSK